jgi:large subunit ribosomal protein L29
MKNKVWQETRNLTLGELERELAVKQKKFFELKVQNRFAPLKNPLEIRNIRRDIARIKSLLGMNFKKKV